MSRKSVSFYAAVLGVVLLIRHVWHVDTNIHI